MVYGLFMIIINYIPQTLYISGRVIDKQTNTNENVMGGRYHRVRDSLT